MSDGMEGSRLVARNLAREDGGAVVFRCQAQQDDDRGAHNLTRSPQDLRCVVSPES